MDNCNCLNLSLCVRESAREIIAIYRGHNNIFNDFKTQLSELVNKIKTRRVIIIGDININIAQNINDESKVEYLNLMAQLGFISCINDYTRIHNNSRSTIDHILVKINGTDKVKLFILESYITDHYSTILIDTENIKNKEEITNIKSFINIKLLKSFLMKEKWETIYNETEVDSCGNMFHNILNNYITQATDQKKK